MLYLTWKGMRGRRRETLLLTLVLVMAFLLSAALAIILPSTRAAAQLQREKSYGSWQLMAYDQSDALCAALQQAAADEGAESARFASVAVTSDGDVISEITPELMELGQFELLEGRLPEAENEIVIVDTQFTGVQGLAVGDELRLQYEWDVSCTESERVQSEGAAQLAQCFADAYAALDTDAYKEEFLLYLESMDTWPDGIESEHLLMAVQGRDSALYSACDDCLQNGKPLAESLTEEQFAQLLEIYLKYARGLFDITEGRANERILIPFDAGKLGVMLTKSRTTLKGVGFGDQRETSINSGRTYSYMELYQNYTVTGIVKGYAATWDSGGKALPSAFVSAEGRSLVEQAKQTALDALDDLAISEQTDTLLLQSSDNAAAFYERMAAVYEETAAPCYDVEVYTDRTWMKTQVLLTGLYRGEEDALLEDAYQMTLSCETRNGQVCVVTNEYETEHGPLTLLSLEGDRWKGQGQWYAIADLSEPDFRIPGLEPLPVSLPEADALYVKNEYDFRINTYAYPQESGNADATLNLVLNGVLMVLTACAVLVICMVQSKHRARSIVLLRAIGLQNSQAAVMQLFEACSFLLLALLIGLPLGALTAMAVLRGMGSGGVMALNGGFLLRSVILGAVSLLVGLQLPLLLAMRMPLTGRTGTISPKMRAADGRELKKGGLVEMETAAKRFHRRRDRTARLLCALVLVLALLTQLLAHFALDTYRAEVVRSDMPDYTLTASYGMSQRYFSEKMEQYTAPDELGEEPSRVEAYLAAEHVTLENSNGPTAQSLDGYLDVAGLAQDSSMLARLIELCGDVDVEKLMSGEGCILLMPNYVKTAEGELQFSSDPVDALRCQTDESYQTGDFLTLTAHSHAVGEDSTRASEVTIEVEVLAVLHEYSGLWLFGESAHPMTVVSGLKLVKMLYPNASSRYDADQARWARQLSRLHCDYCKGKTYFNFYASDEADHSASYWNLSQNEGMELKNYYKEKQELLTAGENQRALTVLLGAAAVLLVLVILGFILSDLAEQGRRRVGILRALGVSGGSMLRVQLRLSAFEAFGAALTANAVIAMLLLVCALAETGFSTLAPAALWSVLKNGLLQQYSWKLHGLLTLGVWALTTLLRTLPYRRLCNGSVIGTIKGLERGE